MIKYVALILIVVLSIGASTVDIRKDPAYRRAVTNGAKAQICVKIVDDDGKPVPHVSVMAVIAMHFSEYQQRGQTDTNGCFVVEGKTTGNYIELWAEKEGYYKSKKKLILVGPEHAHEVKDGKWQPYGAEEKIVLRPRGLPPLLPRIGKEMYVPVTNQWVGIDLLVGDWVKPWGKGSVTDFELNVQWDGLPPWKSRYCKTDMRFRERDAGGYLVSNVLESSFKYSYCANTNASYRQTFEWWDRGGGDPNARDFRRSHHMVIRSRCCHSKSGVLISANYGSVGCLDVGPSREGKPFMFIGYSFNTTPNRLRIEPVGLKD